MTEHPKRDWNIFTSSVFFVLGFSLVFSLLGVLLQTVLSDIGYTVQEWLARIGGTLIILFGLYTVGLIKVDFLQREFKIHPKVMFKSSYLTSFVFGAAFAVGWTPCVGPILGAIFTLAVSHPSSAFFLLFAYTIGLGIPFLLTGFFTNQVKELIHKAGKWLVWLNRIFGVILIFLGILIFTAQLSRFGNFSIAVDILSDFGESALTGTGLGIGVAFLAGLFSFLSPCVLPLVPAFLSYLATVSTKKD